MHMCNQLNNSWKGPTVLATLLVFHEMDIHGKVMNFELLDGNAVFDQMSMRRRVQQNVIEDKSASELYARRAIMEKAPKCSKNVSLYGWVVQNLCIFWCTVYDLRMLCGTEAGKQQKILRRSEKFTRDSTQLVCCRVWRRLPSVSTSCK